MKGRPLSFPAADRLLRPCAGAPAGRRWTSFSPFGGTETTYEATFSGLLVEWNERLNAAQWPSRWTSLPKIRRPT